MSSPKYRLGYPDASLSLPARAGADGSGPDGRHDNADLGGFAGTDGRPPESIPDEPPEHKPGSNAGHGHSASTARYADGIEHSRRVGSPVASSPPIRRRPRLSAILQAQLMLRFGAEPGAFSTSLSRALAVSGRPALSEQSPHCKALHRLTHLFRPQTRRRDHAPGPPFRRDDAALPEEGLAFPRSRSPQLTPSRKLRSQPTGCAFSQPSTLLGESRQFHLQMSRCGRRSQQLTHHTEAKLRPALLRRGSMAHLPLLGADSFNRRREQRP